MCVDASYGCIKSINARHSSASSDAVESDSSGDLDEEKDPFPHVELSDFEENPEYKKKPRFIHLENRSFSKPSS